MAGGLKSSKSNREQRAEAEALFTSIGEGAIVTDEKARISRVNQTALDILGFSEKELVGQWFPEKIVAEDEKGDVLSGAERPIAQAFLNGSVISSRAYYRRKDGSRVPVFLTVSPVLLDFRPIGAIEVFRDISDELALETAKDEFVAIASHQLRTPATAVKQYIGLLLEGYAEPLTENQKLFLERAYESNERQLQIVQEILNITQLDLEKIVLKSDIHDAGDIIHDAIATLKGTFNHKHQRIITKLPPEPIMIKVDREQIRIAIENLLENASNYTRKGKKITVSCAKNKGRVKITIKDEGVGIASADFDRLFRKFSRIPNPLSFEIGGTGLGLYWASKIIDMHGGIIQVKSAVGKGSSFTINIPLGV